MRVTRQHRLDPMAGNLGQIGVVYASGAEVRDVAVAALVGLRGCCLMVALEGVSLGYWDGPEPGFSFSLAFRHWRCWLLALAFGLLEPWLAELARAI